MRIYCTASTISPPSDPAAATRMFDRATDTCIRSAAFDWLQTQVDIHGDVLPWKVLQDGFHLDGNRVPLKK